MKPNSPFVKGSGNGRKFRELQGDEGRTDKDTGIHDEDFVESAVRLMSVSNLLLLCRRQTRDHCREVASSLEKLCLERVLHEICGFICSL